MGQTANPTNRQRLFTDEFKIGQEVAIIRHHHGWHDGEIVGRIIQMSDYEALVQDDEDNCYEIQHPRDIRATR